MASFSLSRLKYSALKDSVSRSIWCPPDLQCWVWSHINSRNCMRKHLSCSLFCQSLFSSCLPYLPPESELCLCDEWDSRVVCASSPDSLLGISPSTGGTAGPQSGPTFASVHTLDADSNPPPTFESTSVPFENSEPEPTVSSDLMPATVQSSKSWSRCCSRVPSPGNTG